LETTLGRTHKPIFFPTQKYFSWHTGKNLKAFVHYCKKMTENAFLLKNTQKWAKNQQ